MQQAQRAVVLQAARESNPALDRLLGDIGPLELLAGDGQFERRIQKAPRIRLRRIAAQCGLRADQGMLRVIPELRVELLDRERLGQRVCRRGRDRSQDRDCCEPLQPSRDDGRCHVHG